MIPRDPSPRRHRVFQLLLASALALSAGTPGAAYATVQRVQALPSNPTTCDNVTLEASGYLPSPSPCYEIVGAGITGPTPPNPLCMAPICPARFEIRIYVRSPGPEMLPCVTVIQPYTRSFEVGPLPEGAYLVRATELVLPAGSDSAGVPTDSTSASLLFFVTKAATCPPQLSCVILDFAPAGTATTLEPPPKVTAPFSRAAADSQILCTATAPPGGSVRVDLALHNDVPVSGLQSEVAIFDPVAPVVAGGPVPSSIFTPTSIAAVGRASGFQAAWSTSNGVSKIVLFSLSGATIAAGDGPLVELSYDVAPLARPGAYVITHWGDVVADTSGAALPPCPTFRETTGRICVTAPGCDLDGNGVSNILDIVRQVGCVLGAGGGPACPDSIAARADCNGDGSVDVRDVICCVRRILQARAGAIQFPVPAPMPPGGETTIGFEGPVRWISPAEASATILLRSSSALGGAEWSVLTDPTRLRVRDLSLIGPAGYHLEWAARPGGGIAFAMLFAEGAVDPTQPIAIQLSLDRVAPSAAPTDVSLEGFQPVAPAGTPLAAGTTGDRLSVPPGGLAAPAVFPARPNPFSAETEIAYSLPAAARVTLRVYDVAGRLVRTLVNGPAAAGVQRVTWNGKDDLGRQARSGIYFVRLEAAGVERSARLLHLR